MLNDISRVKIQSQERIVKTLKAALLMIYEQGKTVRKLAT